jgi:hypothetical protein
MTLQGILLRGFLVVLMVGATTAAIISAAPAIAVVIVVGFLAWLYRDVDFPSDNDDKPP